LTSFDVIVIGAGPAGSAAARKARDLGLSVALIDKAAFPRDKLCGGGVTRRAARELRDVFGLLPGPEALSTHEVRLVAGRDVLGEQRGLPAFAMVMRRRFDAMLYEAAVAAGAVAFCPARIATLDLEVPSVTLQDGRVLRAKALIGADGANSVVAKALHGRAYDPALIGFGMEIEFPAPAGQPPEPVVEIDFTAAVWGYGWAFPKAGGLTLGVGGRLSRNADLRAALAAYAARRGLDPAGLPCKGAFLPFGDPRPQPGRGAVMLAGDAAGLVDPVTGEGIGWALHSGQLAARAVAETIAMPGQAFAAYAHALAPVQAELRRARFIAKLVYHPRLAPRFLRHLHRTPRLQRRFLSLVGGEMDYADIGLASIGRVIGGLVRRG
jgi:menaquinone-9 beta-reductase